MTSLGLAGRPLRDGWPVGTVIVVGVATDRLDQLSPEAREAVGSADVLVGTAGHLQMVGAAAGAVTVEIGQDADADEVARQIRRQAVDGGQRVCVLTAGDPGFFGITRALTRIIDRRSLRILPAVSPVATAFARLGLAWDDAAVVSASDRPLSDAIGAIRTWHKVAVLTSPGSPPESVGAALLDAGVAFDLVAVCTGPGTADEQVVELDLSRLAAGRFDPHSVVVLVGPGGLPLVGWSAGSHRRPPAWGLPPDAVPPDAVPPDAVPSDAVPPDAVPPAPSTVPAELRAMVLGKLALPIAGVLWDLGAGEGSVAIHCALARPGLTVLAVGESPEAAARIARSVASSGAGVHVVTGRTAEVLPGLPAPDRVFVGDAGSAELVGVLDRLRPGGRVVATFAAIDRAAEAAELLGNLAQIGVSLGERLPEGGWNLNARNPVFVAWGP
ncbi:MAG TPA: precorrin-6y C5,15-methyltransferase (decarboxylating) subunit CbiE [Acidimicrobiales bacterium]|nr:precorrin-6y C5,15-methyltransferase (decarboxylating) subunit CbiE [Acidimicrobiales bacterium]